MVVKPVFTRKLTRLLIDVIRGQRTEPQRREFSASALLGIMGPTGLYGRHHRN